MIGTDLDLAARLLREGKLVAVPTETVYGLAANALNPAAVAEIYEVKQRPSFNPLIVHCASVDEAKKYVSNFPEIAEKLADKFWPGPLSLLLPKSELVPDIVTAGLPNVVVRVPSHPILRELLNKLDFPLAAPSANPFKQISPTKAEHVEQHLGDKIPYILDGGSSEHGLESTILSLVNSPPVLLRHGAITQEEIDGITGSLNSAIENDKNPQAPGQLKQHYSSNKPLRIYRDLAEELQRFKDKKVSVLHFGPNELQGDFNYQLSETKDFKEAAANLFKYMHIADADKSDLILAPRVPEKGIGKAINDRLGRAEH
ncbi:threonylcarbamoyl-AMP synthase [bacterium]|nr:threonylcarbamoyl-AMP synthase [bacterium]